MRRYIPRELRIGKSLYRIHITSRLADDLDGLIDLESKEIFIRSGLSKRDTLATLWHEALHAFEVETRTTIHHRTINRIEYVLSEVIERYVRFREEWAPTRRHGVLTNRARRKQKS